MTFFQEEKTCENDAEISNNFEIKQTKQKMIYQSKSNCNLSKRKKNWKKVKQIQSQKTKIPSLKKNTWNMGTKFFRSPNNFSF